MVDIYTLAIYNSQLTYSITKIIQIEIKMQATY